VVEVLGDAERGVLIADETGFVKKGTKSGKHSAAVVGCSVALV
jgi:hypothetical protein